MPRGMAKCRICGKYVPSFYRPYHEKVLCLEMRRRKGLLFGREIPHKTDMPLPEIDKNQRRLLSFGVEIKRR